MIGKTLNFFKMESELRSFDEDWCTKEGSEGSNIEDFMERDESQFVAHQT